MTYAILIAVLLAVWYLVRFSRKQPRGYDDISAHDGPYDCEEQ